MKIRIKHLTVYLPLGSTVLYWKRNTGFVIKGRLAHIACNGHFEMTLTNTITAKGQIDPANRDFRDPDRCVKQLGKAWIETGDADLVIPDDEFYVTDLNQGRIRIDSSAKSCSALFFPDFSCVPT